MDRVVIAGGSGFLGGTLALYGRYCVSRRLSEEGFEFAYPDLASALRELYGRR